MKIGKGDTPSGSQFRTCHHGVLFHDGISSIPRSCMAVIQNSMSHLPHGAVRATVTFAAKGTASAVSMPHTIPLGSGASQMKSVRVTAIELPGRLCQSLMNSSNFR